jgi:hypothetical protein
VATTRKTISPPQINFDKRVVLIRKRALAHGLLCCVYKLINFTKNFEKKIIHILSSLLHQYTKFEVKIPIDESVIIWTGLN